MALKDLQNAFENIANTFPFLKYEKKADYLARAISSHLCF